MAGHVPPSLDVLAQDLADLRAQVTPLLAAASSATAAPEEKKEEAEPAGPMFILALADEDFQIELSALSMWVSGLLVPVYVAGHEISPSAPWCPTWWHHEEAVARLHALWLAWQELTPASAGLAGPSVWHRDHLDPCMAALRHPSGPFLACQTRPDKPTHRDQAALEAESYVPPEPAAAP